MARARQERGLDRDLADLPPDLRWREWLRRIEAVLFASAAPVARDDLASVVGQGASVDLLIADLAADLAGRPYQVARVGAGWMLQTKPAYAPAIKAAAIRAAGIRAAGIRAAADPGGGDPGGGDPGGQASDLSDFDLAVLAAIAYHQPISRDGLKDIFGREINRDLIGRLAGRALITTGPREPRRGAPYTFVTTDTFLAAFGLASLRDLPDPEQLADAGLSTL